MRFPFVGVMVEDCCVVGWSTSADRFVLEIEASLWPGHPAYEAPQPDKWTCYKRAHLVFEGVRSIEGLKRQEDVSPDTDLDGSKDYDSIDSIEQIEGGFRVIGRFGDVTLSASELHLDVLGA
jgi:hypothetical protein